MISGYILKEMVVHAAENVSRKTSYLNSINVFPVPDGDTGTNIYITLDKIRKMTTQAENVLEEVCKAVSKGAFEGAKGNSGVIFSQFLIGFVQELQNHDHISMEEFAFALKEGAARSYKSVLNPKQGTIITVIDAVASRAVEIASHDLTWRDFLNDLFETAQTATRNTQDQLIDLQKAGVIDSGALGFVYILQGWITAILQNTDDWSIGRDLETYHTDVDTDSQIQFRYCTEIMISEASEDPDEAKKVFLELGDSLMVLKDKNGSMRLKMHIHTNAPKQAIAKFAEFGRVETFKVDDMLQQRDVTHS